NDPAVAEVIRETGAELVPYTSTLPVADHDWPDDPIAAMRIFLEDNIRLLPQLEAAYGEEPADLYLYDIGAYAARALAERQRRPIVQLSPSMVGWDGYDEEVAAPLWELPGADDYRARFAGWLAGNGAATTDMDEFSGRPARCLALIPRAMQPNADRLDDGVSYVGPCKKPSGTCMGPAEGRWVRGRCRRTRTGRPTGCRSCSREMGARGRGSGRGGRRRCCCCRGPRLTRGRRGSAGGAWARSAGCPAWMRCCRSASM